MARWMDEITQLMWEDSAQIGSVPEQAEGGERREVR